MTPRLKNLLERAEAWPEPDQDELAEAAREIEARRTGVYVLEDQELIAVQEGIAQADRGEFATDEEVEALWKRHGV